MKQTDDNFEHVYELWIATENPTDKQIDLFVKLIEPYFETDNPETLKKILSNWRFLHDKIELTVVRI